MKALPEMTFETGKHVAGLLPDHTPRVHLYFFMRKKAIQERPWTAFFY